jgi:hypothetical protein
MCLLAIISQAEAAILFYASLPLDIGNQEKTCTRETTSLDKRDLSFVHRI